MVSNSNKTPSSASAASVSMGKVKKSRNRIPTSCSVCRRRKMKCDRAKPHCGSCVTNNTVDICSYNQQPWEYLSTEKQLSNEVLRLKLKINELERALHQQQMVSPPDSLSTLNSGTNNEEEDPFIELGVRFDKLVIKENKLVHYGTTSYLGLQSNDPVLLAMYRKYFLKHLEKYHELILQKKTTKPRDIIEESKNKNNDAICWSEKGLGTNAMIPNALDSVPTASLDDFTNPVNDILPEYEYVMLLFEYFFEKAYPLFPYVDESMFKEDITSILYKGDNGKAILKCTASSQLSIVALLLIMLRIAYLVLPLDDYFVDQDRIKNINTLKLCASDINISPVYVEHAKNCIMNAPGCDNMLKKITLLNIQVLLFLRLYRLIAPEDGDEGADSNILLSMLIQMCRMHGIYRDPELFQDVVSDHRIRHLWRKIWYKLLLLDALQLVQIGAPLIINDDQWDCSLPYLNAADKLYVDAFTSVSSRKNNLLYDPVKFNKLYGEQKIIEGLEVIHQSTIILREVVQLSHNMKVTPRKSDFIKMIKKIENQDTLIMESFSQLQTDVNNENVHHQVLNLKKFSAKTHLILVRYILSYILLLSDEESINDSFNNMYGEDSEYLVKVTENSLQLFKIAFDFLVYETEDELSCNDNKSYQTAKRFYGIYDKLFASQILVGAQRSLQFLSSITLRYGLNFFSFTSLIRNFCNSQDSINVLAWFNICVHDMSTNVDVSLDKKFSIMLYQYIKVFYTKCLLLKDKIFHCLRLNMLIKIFINHLRMHYPDAYKELNGEYTFNRQSDQDEEGIQFNLEQIENLKNQNFDNEDINMQDLLYDNEDEFFNQILNDPKFNSHSLAEFHQYPQQENELLTPGTPQGNSVGPTKIENDVVDSVFSPSFLFSNNPMSPMNQINDILSFKNPTDNSGN